MPKEIKKKTKKDIEKAIIEKFDIDDEFVKGAEIAKTALGKLKSPLNIGKYLMDVGVNRSMEEADELLMLMKDLKLSKEQNRGLSDGSKRLLNAKKEDVSITSIDGLKLVGHIVKVPKAKRVIIAFHGWRSSYDLDFGAISKFFEDEGSTVLYVDQRAQGQSEGEYMSFGVYERFDCIEWVKYAAKKFGKTMPIYLAGLSMGSSTVLMASSEKYPANVKGIIADCGFTSADDIWRHVTTDFLHVPYNQSMLGKICMERLHFDPAKHSTIDALSKATLPVAFIHGEIDHFVPMEMTLFNYDACVSEKEILLVPGADHGMSYLTAKDRYEEFLKKFFKAYDK